MSLIIACVTYYALEYVQEFHFPKLFYSIYISVSTGNTLLSPPGLLSARSDSARKNRLNYRQTVSMFGRIAVSPPEKRGVPGCMLVM